MTNLFHLLERIRLAPLVFITTRLFHSPSKIAFYPLSDHNCFILLIPSSVLLQGPIITLFYSTRSKDCTSVIHPATISLITAGTHALLRPLCPPSPRWIKFICLQIAENSNNIFLHPRFFTSNVKKSTYRQQFSSKRKYFTPLRLRSIDAKPPGRSYRKRDQCRHLSAENTCRPVENLPRKSVVRKRKKKVKEKRKKREEGEKKRKRKKNLSERTLTVVKLTWLARFELIAARNDTFFYLWALLPPCGPSRGLKRTFTERYLAPVQRGKNTLESWER